MGQGVSGVVALCAALAAAFGGAPTAEIGCDRDSKSPTLLVGDSHTVLSGCGRPGWAVDAQPGRNGAQAAAVVEEELAEHHRRLIFDVGTNDVDQPERFRRALQHALSRARGLHVYLVTTYVRMPDVAGNVGAEVNAAMRMAARSHPRRVRIVDWAEYARQRRYHPHDCCHFAPGAYRSRTRMIARSIGRP